MSLLELTTALAVMMLLAAMALPQLADNQIKSRKAELVVNVDGIFTAASAYHYDFDAWWTGPGMAPDLMPGKGLRPWVGFPEIGFRPDGEVRGSYVIADKQSSYCYPTPFASLLCPFEVCASGMSDLDVDYERSCVFTSPKSSTGTWINAAEY